MQILRVNIVLKLPWLFHQARYNHLCYYLESVQMQLYFFITVMKYVLLNFHLLQLPTNACFNILDKHKQ